MAHGVECLFMNPGTDTIPIQEALSKLEQLGEPVPRTVLCLFELVALAAAHGYYQATGRPQAVLVHVDVGTQNLGGMLHNAQRGRAAVLISAGRTPYTTDSRAARHARYLYPLAPGAVRSARHRPQLREVGLRAAAARADGRGRRARVSDRGERPAGSRVPDAAARSPDDRDRRRQAAQPRTCAAGAMGAGDPDALRDVARAWFEASAPSC